MKRILVSLILGGMLALAGAVNAVPPNPYVSILQNASFVSGFASWTMFGNLKWDVRDGVLEAYSTAASSAFFQVANYSTVAGDKYQLTLRIGNSSAAAKTIEVGVVGDAASFSCTFSVPANSPLSTYRVRGVMQASAIVRANVAFVTHDSLPAVLFDDVVLEYVPAAQHTTTICDAPPAPTATPTPTPDTAVVWALPTQVIDGTPQPAQYARLSYDFTAGDLAVSVLLAAVLFTVLAVFTVWLLIGRQKR